MSTDRSQPPPQPIVLPLPIWLVVWVVWLLVRVGRFLWRHVGSGEKLAAEAAAAGQPRHQDDAKCARLAKRLFGHLNHYRSQRGLPPMTWNHRLEQSSLYHAHRMVELGEFNHELSDGVPMSDRIKRFGYRYQLCAENLAWVVLPGQSEGEHAWSIHDGWVHSPGHHANLVGDCQEVGIGVVRDGDRYYAVQNFGTPSCPMSASKMSLFG